MYMPDFLYDMFFICMNHTDGITTKGGLRTVMVILPVVLPLRDVAHVSWPTQTSCFRHHYLNETDIWHLLILLVHCCHSLEVDYLCGLPCRVANSRSSTKAHM